MLKLLKTVLVLYIVSYGACARADAQNLEDFILQTHTRDLIDSLYLAPETALAAQASVPPVDKDSNSSSKDSNLETEVQKLSCTELIYRYFKGPGYFNDDGLRVDQLELAALFSRQYHLIQSNIRIHRYDNPEDLKHAFGPDIDNELCMRQLEHLDERLSRLEADKFNSTDLNLYRLLDSFGRVPPGLTAAVDFSPGMYDNCLRLQIEAPDSQRMPTRYCVAQLRRANWPRAKVASRASSVALSVGVCLPRSCDQSRYSNKYRLIRRLIDFNARPLDRGQFELHNLYCLPDEDSPLRSWWTRPQSALAVAAFGLWLAVVVFATFKHEWSSRRGRPTNELYKMLSATSGLKLLLGSGGLASIATSGEDKQRSVSREITDRVDERAEPELDLSPMDGIKTILMTIVVTSHTLITNAPIKSNYTNAQGTSSATLFMNSCFFSLTGFMFAYKRFGQTDWRGLVRKPARWLAFYLNRYALVMPSYLLAIVYIKYVSKYTGSGPFWDYGTSSISRRGFCERNSWFWSLTMTGNLRSITGDCCIPPDWYLNCDLQFYLVTPLFMSVLQRNPNMGRGLLVFSALASAIAGFLSALQSDVPDLRPYVNVMPNFVGMLDDRISPSTYIRPYYRIAPYLCGLLLGYELHNYRQRQLKPRSMVSATKLPDQLSRSSPWPRWFVRFGQSMTMLTVGLLLLISLPLSIETTQFAAKFCAYQFGWLNLLCGFTCAFYVLMVATKQGNLHRGYLYRFLSAPIWRPLARLNLFVMLTNFEVIGNIAQSVKQPIYTDFSTDLAYKLLALTANYLVAFVFFIFFAAPLGSLVLWLMSGGHQRGKKNSALHKKGH